MSKFQNKDTGSKGEQYATLYLEKLGYEIVQSNFSTRYGEIDIICRDNGILVFIEVKTKIGLGFGLPEEMFTRYKYDKVKRMATLYLKGKEVPCRIDMVAVELTEEKQVKQIRHYQNVTW